MLNLPGDTSAMEWWWVVAGDLNDLGETGLH